MEEDYIRFDRRKFKQVVHYICAHCDADKLGNIKLHKILYFADMMHFSSKGKPLTGVDYLKQRFGPIARHLTSALSDLQAEGKLDVRTRDYFGFQKKDYVSVAPLEALSITNEEAELLQDVIAFVCEHSAKTISDLSHDLTWQIAKLGERMPYAAVEGWGPSVVSDRDVELATTEARRIRPLIEAERRESRVF